MMTEALLELSLQKFDAAVQIARDLGDDRVNERPALPGANSPFAIVTHCLGMMRFWSSTVNRGIPVPRDRDAEFTASGSVADLAEHAAVVRARFIEDVRAVQLGEAPVGRPTPGRIGESWTGTCGGVLMHVLEELAQHLGHLEITRDLLLATAGASASTAEN